MDTWEMRTVSSLDLEFDFDSRVNKLETEWREALEANLVARAAYHALTANRHSDVESLDRARERLERSEALKGHIMNKIDQLERRFQRRSDRRS